MGSYVGERIFFLPFYFIIEEFLISVEVIDLSFCQWKFFTSNVLKTSSLPLSVICSSDYTSSPLQCWSQWFWDSAFTQFLCFCVLKSTYACCFERTWFSLIVYWKSGTHMPLMHCDVCWASHNCWKFHCKMPDMRGGRMEEIRKNLMPSLPQNRESKVVLRVENSQFDVMDWFPLPQGSPTYFLMFFCLPGWHPDSLYFTLLKCCLSGHSGVLEVVGMIVQPSVLAEPLQHTSTHFALLMINLGVKG